MPEDDVFGRALAQGWIDKSGGCLRLLSEDAMNQEDINEMVNRGNEAMGRTKTIDAVELAYGLLWMYHGDDPVVHQARKLLLDRLSQDQRASGITAARKIHQQARYRAIPPGDHGFRQELDAAQIEIQLLRSLLGSTVPALQQHHGMARGGPVKSERLALLKSVVNATSVAGE